MTLFEKILLLSVSVAGLAAAQGTPPYYGETPCGSVNCSAIVQDIDNIAIFEWGTEVRVDFRSKSNPGKNLWFSGSPDIAKSVLAVLLTAKSTGARVKIAVPSSTNPWDGPSPTKFTYATLIDP